MKQPRHRLTNVSSKGQRCNLDIFWLKDESLEDSANLAHPAVRALKITEDLEAALAQFAAVTDAKQRPGFPVTDAKQWPGFPIAADLKR